MKKIAICMSLLIGQAWALSCTTPVTISEPGWDVSAPKVDINEKGEALVLWLSENYESQEDTLFAATRDGEKWSTAALSGPANVIDDEIPFIDRLGNQFVCW